MVGMTLQQTRIDQEAKAEGREEGREAGERSLVRLLLTQKFGELPSDSLDRINRLQPAQLEALAIALLEFEVIDHVVNWLDDAAD